MRYVRPMRIIGGAFRSRALVAPPGTGTRPTTDRVREAIFSMVEARMDLTDVRVLDLFAGSGALGLEAMSRGAIHGTFVESARGALGALRKNCEALGVGDRVEVVPLSVERGLAVLRGPFLLIFADPPYAQVAQRASPLSAVLEAMPRLLASGGLFVLEHGARDAPPEIGALGLARTGRHGDSAVSLYQAQF